MAPFIQSDLVSSSTSHPLLHLTSEQRLKLLGSVDVEQALKRVASSGDAAGSQELSSLQQGVIREILSFIKETKTFQLSSLGPTGMVIMDLLHRAGILALVPVVFIDTLHHFEETYQLLERVRQRYPEVQLLIYKPKGMETRADFEEKFGQELWVRAPSKYAYYTKVEPRDRAMAELEVKAYINGRRKSQGNQRKDLTFTDTDPELGIIRVQPLYNWTFEQVWGYIRQNNVPYNALHDQGYKSVGDFMTTAASSEEEGERGGRWKGSNQTECGLHLSPSALAQLAAAH